MKTSSILAHNQEECGKKWLHYNSALKSQFHFWLKKRSSDKLESGIDSKSYKIDASEIYQMC